MLPGDTETTGATKLGVVERTRVDHFDSLGHDTYRTVRYDCYIPVTVVTTPVCRWC